MHMITIIISTDVVNSKIFKKKNYKLNEFLNLKIKFNLQNITSTYN